VENKRLEDEIFSSHVYGPCKFLPLCLVVDFLNGYLPLLTPGHGDARIQVVQLGRAQGYLLVLLLQDKIRQQWNHHHGRKHWLVYPGTLSTIST